MWSFIVQKLYRVVSCQIFCFDSMTTMTHWETYLLNVCASMIGSLKFTELKHMNFHSLNCLPDQLVQTVSYPWKMNTPNIPCLLIKFFSDQNLFIDCIRRLNLVHWRNSSCTLLLCFFLNSLRSCAVVECLYRFWTSLCRRTLTSASKSTGRPPTCPRPGNRFTQSSASASPLPFTNRWLFLHRQEPRRRISSSSFE